MRRLLGLALAAGVLAAAAVAADFTGKAQALMPTPKETAFPKLIEFTRARKPTGALAAGWKEGVAAIYGKGTGPKAVQAAATVFVYSNGAGAKRAWQQVCPKCAHTVVAGLQMRYETGKLNGVLAFESFTYCGNVYVNALAQGGETAVKLGQDVGTIIAGVYRRAVHFGMSACK